MRKYAWSGMSTFTPGGTHTNEPPDHTAVFKAASLLSFAGITVPKYCFTMSSCCFSAVSVSQKMTPLASRSLRMLWYTDSLSYWAPTPARYFCSASGMPSLSNVRFT